MDVFPKLNMGMSLFSASGLPTFTNYTKGFKDLLDYIYVQTGHFEVTRVAKFPDEATLAADTALPSRVFPSDHIAVAVDVIWKPPKIQILVDDTKSKQYVEPT
jgi:mRNA deadenylase 3'-5' endonuclease subunit Ccr4